MDVLLDLVLVRGPRQVPRRLHLTLPADGTPASIGRSPHCTAVLAPYLVFASQVQASVFQVPRAATAVVAAGESTDDYTTPDKPSDSEKQQQQPAFDLFITDMCSSNGTFLNSVRLSGTTPSLLHDGDEVILGGMRDVPAGAALPPDARTFPEIAVWRVDVVSLHADKNADSSSGSGSKLREFGFEATPMMVPTAVDMEAEEKALLATVQRSLRTVADSDAAPAAKHGKQEEGEVRTPSVGRGGRIREAEAELQTPVVKPQQLFALEATPATTAKKNHPMTHTNPNNNVKTAASPLPRISGLMNKGKEEQEKEEEELARRSATVPAQLGLQRERSLSLLTPPHERPQGAPQSKNGAPPGRVGFFSIRVGSFTFHVPESERQSLVVAAAIAGQKEEQAGAVVAAVGRKRGRAGKAKHSNNNNEKKKEEKKTTVSPFCLSFTPTHWKWAMGSPNATHREPLFHGLLPPTSVQSWLVCAERLGMAVELREGCQLPLLDAAVMGGAPEDRWIVWLLEDPSLCRLPAELEAEAEAGKKPAARKAGRRETKRRKLQNVEGDEEEKGQKNSTRDDASDGDNNKDDDDDDDDKEEKDRSVNVGPQEAFQELVSHLECYYGAMKFPAPAYVDGKTFDKVFAPY